MRGTWQTTGGGSGIGAVLVLGAVLLAGAGVAAGVAEGIAGSEHELLIIAAGVVLILIPLAWLLFLRVRRAMAQGNLLVSRYTLAEPEREPKAVAASQPAAVVNHYHGPVYQVHAAPGADASGIIRQALTESAATEKEGNYHANLTGRPDPGA